MHGTFNAVIPLANVLVMPMNDLVIGVAGLVGIIALLLFDIVLFLYDRFISQERLFTKPLAP
jgi:hypothetical protein